MRRLHCSPHIAAASCCCCSLNSAPNPTPKGTTPPTQRFCTRPLFCRHRRGFQCQQAPCIPALSFFPQLEPDASTNTRPSTHPHLSPAISMHHAAFSLGHPSTHPLTKIFIAAQIEAASETIHPHVPSLRMPFLLPAPAFYAVCGDCRCRRTARRHHGRRQCAGPGACPHHSPICRAPPGTSRAYLLPALPPSHAISPILLISLAFTISAKPGSWLSTCCRQPRRLYLPIRDVICRSRRRHSVGEG